MRFYVEDDVLWGRIVAAVASGAQFQSLFIGNPLPVTSPTLEVAIRLAGRLSLTSSQDFAKTWSS